MTQSFQDPITLDMLAKICDINKYYLAYLFKKEIGMAPINYLNDVRIKEAKILLATTDLTIGEIANITGFSSQSFFTQVFKREAGLTPSQFRKINKTTKKVPTN